MTADQSPNDLARARAELAERVRADASRLADTEASASEAPFVSWMLEAARLAALEARETELRKRQRDLGAYETLADREVGWRAVFVAADHPCAQGRELRDPASTAQRPTCIDGQTRSLAGSSSSSRQA